MMVMGVVRCSSGKISEKLSMNSSNLLCPFFLPDRYIVIGAPRASLPGVSQDALTSTAALLQLARSLNVAHQLKQWKPQRGIKLVSWGGVDIGNMGMLQHIKVRFLSDGIERERN